MGLRLAAPLMLLLPFASVLMAGCTDACDPGPPVTARGILSAATAGGSGEYALDLVVVDGPGGAPIAGAGVVVYWGDATASEWRAPRVEVQGGSSGGSVVVDPGVQAETVESTSTVRLMTDAEGRARANVPANRIVGVVAAKEGFTEEWVPALATGDGGTSGAIELPLFRTHLALDMDAVWSGPGAGSSGAVTRSSYAWDPHALPFGETEEAHRAYAARIVELTVTIEWSNEATAFGDLGVGVGHEQSGPSHYADSGQNAQPGAQTETTTMGLDELVEKGILGAPVIRAGAASDTGFVGPFGLPYTMHVEARFDRELAERASACGSVRGSGSDDDGIGASVPGFDAALGVAAVAVVALAARTATRR